jgi:hypothetical protein
MRGMSTAITLAVLAAAAASEAQNWEADDAIFNPSGIPSLPFSQPRLADLDGDDDFDLILGSIDDAPLYFENIGSAGSPAFARGGDILAPIDPLDAEMAVAGDLDGDDDLDLVTGGFLGLQLFANVGDVHSPAFERVVGFFAGLQVGTNPVPTLADLDDDSDLDLLVGLSESGQLKYYPNQGSPTAAVFTEASAAIWFDVGLFAYPWFADLDGDLDFDLLAGRDEHGFRFYRNIGDPMAWSWENDDAVFAGLAGATYWNSPCLVDLTGDDRLDLVYGTYAGPLQYFVNTGSLEVPVWTPDTSLFGGVLDVGGASSPFFHDFDGDEDLDLVSGSQLGDIKYYENTGTVAAPAWNADHAYFASIDHSIYSAITLGDVDDDGLADAVVGDLNGHLFFHPNNGSGFDYDDTVFVGVNLGGWSVPRFVDMDGDLDLDLVAGNEAGQLTYLENQGTVAAPAWVVIPGYFGGLDVGSNCSLTLGDYDHDDDQDLITGNLSHQVRYFAHVGGAWVEDASVLAGITAGQNAAPALADLDGDGDLDLTLGNYTGTFNYYRNTSATTAVPSGGVVAGRLALSASPNPFNPVTNLHFRLNAPSAVSLVVYDLVGRRVRTLAEGNLPAGVHDFRWDGRNEAGAPLGSGMYFGRLHAGREVRTTKLLLLK